MQKYMNVVEETNNSTEKELSKIRQIFYPIESYVTLKDCVDVTTTILFRADVIKAKKIKNKSTRQEIRLCMLQYLAENSSKNLKYLFATKRKRAIQYLLFYESSNDAETSQFMLDGKTISTQFGPTQIYSEMVTNAYTIKCVPPPVNDCYQFMLKRLEVLNLAGCPTTKRLLRSIFKQRKHNNFDSKKATLTSLPADDNMRLPVSEDDEAFSDSGLSSKSSRTDASSDHQSPKTVQNSLVSIRAIEDEASNVSTNHSGSVHTSFNQLPVQPTISQLNHEERVLQLRYWGLSEDTDTPRCTICALEGHISRYCPSLKCAKCNASQEHSSDACPTYQVCTKCRERGHRKEDCPAKLARTSADGFICHRCNQKGHVEETCSSLWRSYKPSTNLNVVKVDDLLVSCYQCGLNDHWGDDCKVIPKRKTIINTNNVFSAESANTYLSKPMESAINTRSSIRSSQRKNYSSEEDDPSFFTRIKKPKQVNQGTIRIRTGSNTSKATSQPNSKHQSRTHSESRNFMIERHRPYPSYSSHTHTNQLENQYELPVDTYWRSGNIRQPPLPNEPLPSPSSIQEMAFHRSYEGQYDLPGKQPQAQQQKRYSYSRNSYN